MPMTLHPLGRTGSKRAELKGRIAPRLVITSSRNAIGPKIRELGERKPPAGRSYRPDTVRCTQFVTKESGTKGTRHTPWLSLDDMFVLVLVLVSQVLNSAESRSRLLLFMKHHGLNSELRVGTDAQIVLETLEGEVHGFVHVATLFAGPNLLFLLITRPWISKSQIARVKQVMRNLMVGKPLRALGG